VAAAEFFRAAHNVKKGLAANEAASAPAPQPQQNGPSWSQQGPQQQAAPAPPPGGEHRCIHGPREYKDFTSKAGKHIKIWSCTAPRGQQCDPEWVK
jgi:hypothetical protein